MEKVEAEKENQQKGKKREYPTSAKDAEIWRLQDLRHKLLNPAEERPYKLEI